MMVLFMWIVFDSCIWRADMLFSAIFLFISVSFMEIFYDCWIEIPAVSSFAVLLKIKQLIIFNSFD